MKRSKWKEYASWYLLLLIPLAGTVIFNVYPLIQTFIDSFQNMKNVFIGGVNYKILWEDEIFRQSVVNTLYMAVLGVCFNVPIAFIIANMLNNIPIAKNVYKVVFLLPMIMSMITVGTLFKYLMMPGEEGIFNFLLEYIGLGPYDWLNDPAMARESLIVMVVWKGMGYNIILFFAGLQAVPRELYEAAKIDGASEFKQWIYITIPSMKSSFTFVIITSTIAALKRFTDVYAISGETGNPAGALNTIMLYVYRNSFSTLNYKDLGRSSAASIVLFVIILIITLLNFKLTGSDNTETKVPKRRRG
ncbi:sn-glycerol-3-phosphate transport system permease protein ugpA [uncultured Ruminococcus sp.]|uniref:Sugar ABC transporter permease n=1 Tax=Massiliimalia timonensis TaxID=1987501 RepID=A0A8J6P5T2_9FIRM|nr:sugar ABC transporter permease [Massiliimalia timonensis]MBC8609645.1 sugar ABC transporter permease [Massiliimalia timonensis]SCH33137.1 sn-glycerol-3-phosphate transport system permease protein ugpA [uncultured Ruminococcus sp.]SCH36112.1 sn-glycerol-3-phosphate transport system permease protein ugpA [uncultured Clostridium sp.]